MQLHARANVLYVMPISNLFRIILSLQQDTVDISVFGCCYHCDTFNQSPAKLRENQGMKRRGEERRGEEVMLCVHTLQLCQRTKLS